MSVGDRMAGFRGPRTAWTRISKVTRRKTSSTTKARSCACTTTAPCRNDNPFVGRAGALPEIWSWGHRNPQGLAVHPETGELWETEHGPQGGDELNLIGKGANYGWPVIGYGANYTIGTEIHASRYKEGMEQPKAFWVPSIGISGLMFYTGDKFPNWKGNAFVGGMAGNYRQLVRVSLNGRRSSRIASRCCSANIAFATCARGPTASSISPSTTSSRASRATSFGSSRSSISRHARVTSWSQSRCARRSRGGRNGDRSSTIGLRPRLSHGLHRRLFRRAVRERRWGVAPSGARTHHGQRRREEARGHFLGWRQQTVYRFDIVNTDRGDTGTQTVIRNADGSKTMHMVRLKV